MAKKAIVGLDIGGTKVEAVLFEIADGHSDDETCLNLISPEGNDIRLIQKKSQRIPTNRGDGYPRLVERITELIKEVAGRNKFDGIGIGLPGTVDPHTLKMLNGNTGIFIGQDFAGDLRAGFGDIKININNDANCFALAEALCGAGRTYTTETGIAGHEQVAIGVILGTGCGGGAIIKGEILTGRHGGGAEIGHSTLYYDGRPCYCERRGCAEQYLSGPGLEAAYATRMYSQIDKLPKAKDIFNMAANKEPAALAVVADYKKHLALFLSNLTNIFDPDYFVLGGGVSSQKQIYAGLEEALYDLTFVKESRPKIYKHALSDSAGVIGAAISVL